MVYNENLCQFCIALEIFTNYVESTQFRNTMYSWSLISVSDHVDILRNVFETNQLGQKFKAHVGITNTSGLLCNAPTPKLLPLQINFLNINPLTQIGYQMYFRMHFKNSDYIYNFMITLILV